MDENKDFLSLEDIMKEFGHSDQPEADEMLDEAMEQMPIAQEPPLEERLKAFLPPEEPAQVDAEEVSLDQRIDALLSVEDEDVKAYIPQTHNADPAMDGQTIRVDPKEIRAAMEGMEVPDGATMRFEPLGGAEQPDTDGGTIRFEPVADRAAPEPTKDGTIRFDPAELAEKPQKADQLPEGAEPFSQNWEPHYDEPMGEYVPPEPLVFRPRSRLHELKRKLIAGPERRYYALMEQGLGKLQAAIFLSVLVVILSFVAIGMHSMGLVQENRMRLLVFGELFAMTLSALLGSSRILEGLVGIFKGKFTPDSILVLSFVICIADGVFCLQAVRVPFCGAFCLEMTMSLWAEYQRRNVETAQMDTLRKAVRLNRVAKAPDCYDGKPGFYVTDGEVVDFMDTYSLPTAPEKTMHVYCLLAFLASIAIAVVAGLAKGVVIGLQTWSAAILAAMPVTTFICQSRPAAVLERRFHKLGIVLCGWQGIKAAAGSAVVPLTDKDLLPAGSVKINGVKFYSLRDSDQVIAYAAAIMECSDNALTNLFTQLLDSRNGRHYDADSFRSYENGGLGGEVCGESVLLGSAQFLQDMGVEIPEGTRVSQAVYVAVDGELCAVFALAFGKLKGVAAGLGALSGSKQVTPVIVGENFLVNEGFLKGKFSVNTRRMSFPTGEQRQAVESWVPDGENSVPCALTTQDGLASTAFAITGARALRTARNLGAFVHMAAGILGMAMVLVLTLAGADSLLTPANLLLFHLVWCVPGLLISSWTKFM